MEKITIDPDIASTFESQNETSNTKDGLPLANQWLRRCMGNHRLCNDVWRQTPPRPPTKLVYLGQSESELCLKESLPHSTNYATLSHRWGNCQYNSLTKATLS